MKKPAASSQQLAAKAQKRVGIFKLQAPGSRLQAGFSLIEMIVSIALFSIIMVVAIGALLALVNANRKARALESVMNNLNITLDGMVRAIRMGSVYNCGSTAIPDTDTDEGDCEEDGSSTFSFAPYGSDSDIQGERWAYTFSNGQLFKSEVGGPQGFAVTAPEVAIEDMRFYVVGTETRNTTQPKVVIVVKGTAGSEKLNTSTTFYIQATAVQRALDL